jgi:hypothetical protein
VDADALLGLHVLHSQAPSSRSMDICASPSRDCYNHAYMFNHLPRLA